MGRILFLALIIALLFWVIGSYRRSLKKREEAHEEPRSLEGEDMVRCVHCGVHLPRSESIRIGCPYRECRLEYDLAFYRLRGRVQAIWTDSQRMGGSLVENKSALPFAEHLRLKTR